jgi:XTP/dITP diphosphohydrolase
LRHLVLASGNPDKLRELREILRDLEFDVIPVGEIVENWDVEETGHTLEENALLKARVASEATGLPAVADDTGLFVSALGGAPGIYAARYAGSGCSYEDNVTKLLTVLKGESGESRNAVFRTAAALVIPGNGEYVVKGEVSGFITEKPSGEGGFGYDPVFFLPELGMTFAESPAERKNAVSHRAKAFRALGKKIEEVLSSSL